MTRPPEATDNSGSRVSGPAGDSTSRTASAAAAEGEGAGLADSPGFAPPPPCGAQPCASSDAASRHAQMKPRPLIVTDTSFGPPSLFLPQRLGEGALGERRHHLVALRVRVQAVVA